MLGSFALNSSHSNFSATMQWSSPSVASRRWMCQQWGPCYEKCMICQSVVWGLTSDVECYVCSGHSELNEVISYLQLHVAECPALCCNNWQVSCLVQSHQLHACLHHSDLGWAGGL